MILFCFLTKQRRKQRRSFILMIESNREPRSIHKCLRAWTHAFMILPFFKSSRCEVDVNYGRHFQHIFLKSGKPKYPGRTENWKPLKPAPVQMLCVGRKNISLENKCVALLLQFMLFRWSQATFFAKMAYYYACFLFRNYCSELEAEHGRFCSTSGEGSYWGLLLGALVVKGCQWLGTHSFASSNANCSASIMKKTHRK